MSTEAPVIVVLGPTATGKSALGMRLARHLDGEILNADALQVYRGFDIGTAKPSPEDRAEIPHHLVDILGPDERWSAGEFARRAREAIGDVRSRGRQPIVVGGSGLYLRAEGADGGDVLSFESMQNQGPVVGSRAWRRYELVHEVPDDAEYLFFGLIVDGPGKVWMDDLELVPVSDDVALTGKPQRQEKPANLDFERGFDSAPGDGGDR